MHAGEGPVPSFEGISPDPSIDAHEKPELNKALDRAAQAAAEAGYAGQTFEVAIEVVPEEHNQWIRTFTVIITGHGHS
jgi:nucleotide-binding universal stress UspA family protein